MALRLDADERRAVVVLEQVAGAAIEVEVELVLSVAERGEDGVATVAIAGVDDLDQAGVAIESLERVDSGDAEVEVQRDLLARFGDGRGVVALAVRQREVSAQAVHDHEVGGAGRIAEDSGAAG